MFLKSLLLWFCLSVSIGCLGQGMRSDGSTPGTDVLDAKNGFRTFKFGTLVSTIPGMESLSDTGDSRFYMLKNENLTIGTAHLEDIGYEFYKGKLASVIINVKGIVNSRKVFEVLTAQYGQGHQANEYLETYNWFGRTVILTYRENAVNHDTVILFQSRAFKNQKKADEEVAAKKATSDL